MRFRSGIWTALLFLASSEALNPGLQECSLAEQKTCLRGDSSLHLCTALVLQTTSGDVGATGHQPTKIVCECRPGYSELPPWGAQDWRFSPVEPCVPCQEEGKLYQGLDALQDSGMSSPSASALALNRVESASGCQMKCNQLPTCNFWTYNMVSKVCYLKRSRGDGVSLNTFVSGLKNCSTPSHYWSRTDSGGLPNLPLVEVLHPPLSDQPQRTVLQGVPAMFGPQLEAKFAVQGFPEWSTRDRDLCTPPKSVDVSGDIVLAFRGGCSFLDKSINAQLAGYKGLVVLDEASNTRFQRIVAPDDKASQAAFVKIPTVFLRTHEAVRLQELLAKNRKVLIRLSGSEAFSSFLDASVQIRFKEPEDPKRAQVSRLLSSASVTNASATEAGEIQGTAGAALGDGRWSGTGLTITPLGIVFVILTVLLLGLGCIAGGVYLCRRRRRRSRSRRALDAICTGAGHKCGSGVAAGRCCAIDVAPDGAKQNAGLSASSQWWGWWSSAADTETSESPEMAVVLNCVECPICYDAIWPPKRILQCTKGHILCETCIKNPHFDKKCPSCRENFSLTSPSRNLALENLFASLLSLAAESHSQLCASGSGSHDSAPSAPALEDAPASAS